VNPGDAECWTAGHIYAFFVDLKALPIIEVLRR
jgi:hypothetical protein